MNKTIQKQKANYFIGVNDRLVHLLSDTGLNKFKKVFIYGSVVRNLWNNEEFKSIDIGVDKKTDCSELTRKLNNKYSYSIETIDIEKPEEFVFKSSDFNIGEILYCNGYFYYPEDFFINFCKRKLLINYKNISDHNVTLARLFKYLDRNYWIDQFEINGFVGRYNGEFDFNRVNVSDNSNGIIIEDTLDVKFEVDTFCISAYPDIRNYFQYILKVLNISEILKTEGLFFHSGPSLNRRGQRIKGNRFYITAQTKNAYNNAREILLKKSDVLKEDSYNLEFRNHIFLQKDYHHTLNDLCRSISVQNECLVIDFNSNEIAFPRNYFEINYRKMILINPNARMSADTFGSLLPFLASGYKIMKKDLEWILKGIK